MFELTMGAALANLEPAVVLNEPYGVAYFQPLLLSDFYQT